ncbi:MAG: YCF48-related protein [Myxococcota bacterium]|nr:YCF48-related protein [Myxococcota bacterium]
MYRISRYGLFLSMGMVAWQLATRAAVAEQRNLEEENAEEPTFEALFDTSFVDEQTGWAVGRNGIIIHTNDSGVTWELQHRSKLPEERILRSVSFADRQHGVAVGTHGQILTSSDGGKHWVPSSRVRNPQIKRYEERIELLNKEIARIRSEAEEKEAHESDATPTAAVSSPSEDPDGQSTPNQTLIPDEEPADVAVLEKELGQLISYLPKIPKFVSPGRISEIEFLEVSYVGRDNAWILYGWGLLHSKDQGHTWRIVELPAKINGMFFLDANHAWLVGRGGTVLRTQDGGKTFDSMQLEYTWDLLDVQFLNPSLGFLCGQGGLLMKSVDGGRTWQKIDTEVKEDLFRIAMMTPTSGVVTTLDGPAIQTSDGLNWQFLNFYDEIEEKTQPVPAAINASRIDETKGIIVGSWGLVAITKNSGENWDIVRSSRKYDEDLFEKYKSTRHTKGIIELELGYVHPVGKIATRFGPGAMMSTIYLGGWSRIKLGGGILIKFMQVNETIAAPSETPDEGQTEMMNSTGMGVEFPLMIDWHAVERGGLVLRLSASIGPKWEGTILQKPWQDRVDPSDYERSRWGIGLSQAVYIAYVYKYRNKQAAKSLPPRRRVERIGFYLRLGLSESWTWNVAGKLADLGGKDEKDFGTELWPHINLGWSTYY